jgi:hypothetical protein
MFRIVDRDEYRQIIKCAKDYSEAMNVAVDALIGIASYGDDVSKAEARSAMRAIEKVLSEAGYEARPTAPMTPPEHLRLMNATLEGSN